MAKHADMNFARRRCQRVVTIALLLRQGSSMQHNSLNRNAVGLSLQQHESEC